MNGPHSLLSEYLYQVLYLLLRATLVGSSQERFFNRRDTKRTLTGMTRKQFALLKATIPKSPTPFARVQSKPPSKILGKDDSVKLWGDLARGQPDPQLVSISHQAISGSGVGQHEKALQTIQIESEIFGIHVTITCLSFLLPNLLSNVPKVWSWRIVFSLPSTHHSAVSLCLLTYCSNDDCSTSARFNCQGHSLHI